jgi:hypothetical protein
MTERREYSLIFLFAYLLFFLKNLGIYYPGGLGTSENVDPTTTEWYTTASASKIEGAMFVLGPYLDLTTSQKILTISSPIIDKNGIVYGVSTISMQVKDL